MRFGINSILALRKLEFVHEIISGGSTGTPHKVATLAEGAGLKFEFIELDKVEVKKSANQHPFS